MTLLRRTVRKAIQSLHGMPMIVFSAGLMCSLAAVGCAPINNSGSNSNPTNPTNGSAPMTIVVADTPPTGLTLLGFEATVTGVTLTPASGSAVTVISSSNPVTLELASLQGDETMLGTLSVPAGTYNSMTISVANPAVTFLNNTGATITVGTVICPNATVCQIEPSTAANVMFTTAPFPLTVTANTPVALLVDFNINNIVSPTLALNFSTGLTVSSFTIPSSGIVTPMEDILGQIKSIDVAQNNFTVATSQATYQVNVNSSTSFVDFLAGGCSSHNIGCLAVNQAVAMNLDINSDGTLLAQTVTFENSNLDEPLAEGVIISVDSSTQFHMIVLNTLPTVQGLNLGSLATVTTSGITTFSIDNDGPDTTAFTAYFLSSANLTVGQEVQVEELSTSLGTSIQADRVRLRDSRFTATISLLSSPNFNVNALPALFTSAGITQIQAQTSSATEFTGSASAFSNLTSGQSVTLRGQIFNTGTAIVMPVSKVTGH
jgi:Domain of unknown function (DUF4382)/Domain of unknown function (DUF5666)